jgi:peptidoglycan/LPS O-acetylase OafA/YrhL
MAVRDESGSAPVRGAEPAARRRELDMIRLVVVLGLVFFHAALVFDARDDYYVKNPQTTEATTILAGLGVVWAMPALFLIAGVGSWYSLRRRGPRGFAAERLLRLGVPLVFATLTIIPVPQWLRLKAADPGYDESYPRFLARFFDVHIELSDFPFVLDGEHFETGHLWFVVLLLAFSLMVTPVAAWLPGHYLARVRDGLASAVRRRAVVLVAAVPLALIAAGLGMEESFAGWSRWAYLVFFLYGLLLAADDRVRAAIRRDAVPAAVLGIALFAVAGVAFGAAVDDPFTEMTGPAIVGRTAFGAAGWCWLVAITGLLDRPARQPASPEGSGDQAGRSHRRAVYAYLATAALPIYILHQPILVTVAYFVVRWQTPSLVKYAAIVAISFMVIFVLYDLCVRRTRPTRFLFGIRD